MRISSPEFRRVAMMAALVLAISGGCSFVQMETGAQAVRVVGPGQLPAGCTKRGEIEVSVKDRLGPYERQEMRVKDELETLARNEAPGLNADTIQPKTPPADGEQRFLAFHCGAITPSAQVGPPPPAESGDRAETTPLKDD